MSIYPKNFPYLCHMNYQNNLTFAQQMDQNDPLKASRQLFHLPTINIKGQEQTAIYFCGNSLGAQPKSVRAHIEQELQDWQQLGVEGHFKGKNAWFYYHHFLTQASANLVGALPSEVVVMNSLTVNLHLMLVSFYRPTKSRYKILIESPAFPSDKYAVDSHAQWHGFNPNDVVVVLSSRAGEETLRTEDILSAIEAHKDELALVMFGGVNYYTGQYFDLKTITVAGHQAGATVGFDLAHAAGNVPMQLHDWNVDFAVWCTYKYLNSGPGGPGGAFIHEKHRMNPDLPRFAGWWGHNEDERFLMKKGFQPMPGAAGWQLSNAQIFSMAAHKASLDMFEEVGMAALRQKSEILTAYMQFLIEDLNKQGHQFNIITPKNPQERGCQLSILTGENGKTLHEYLTNNGVISDWREPNVIRVAAVPMYNSFEDVYRFVQLLKSI